MLILSCSFARFESTGRVLTGCGTGRLDPHEVLEFPPHLVGLPAANAAFWHGESPICEFGLRSGDPFPELLLRAGDPFPAAWASLARAAFWHGESPICEFGLRSGELLLELRSGDKYPAARAAFSQGESPFFRIWTGKIRDRKKQKYNVFTLWGWQ